MWILVLILPSGLEAWRLILIHLSHRSPWNAGCEVHCFQPVYAACQTGFQGFPLDLWDFTILTDRGLLVSWSHLRSRAFIGPLLCLPTSELPIYSFPHVPSSFPFLQSPDYYSYLCYSPFHIRTLVCSPYVINKKINRKQNSKSLFPIFIS